MTIKIKNYLFLALCAVSFGSLAYGMESVLSKQAPKEIGYVQDYLAGALENARVGNFEWETPHNGTVQLKQRGNDCITLDYKDDALIGLVQYHKRNKNSGAIDLLEVKEPWRNHGIASSLLLIAQAQLMKMGCGWIKVFPFPYQAEVENVEAMDSDPVFIEAEKQLIRFYERFGFKKSEQDYHAGYFVAKVEDSVVDNHISAQLNKFRKQQVLYSAHI